MADAFKPITMTPMTGLFDSRSTSDQIAPGTFSWKQNIEISNDGKFKNARGFTKPYGINPFYQNIAGVPCQYANWDFHNQAVVDIAHREPPTLLFPSTANDGGRRLYMATKTRVLLMDELAGSWSVIGSGFGADENKSLTQVRFKAAQLQNTIVLTNGFDKVQYHTIGSTSVQEITDLDTAGAGGGAITKAKVVIQYNGVMMIMNVMESGSPQPSRIWWSDLNLPLSWNEVSDSSISDFQDLSYGQAILAAVVVQGFLYIFTDKSIWRATFTFDPTSGSATLICTEVYTDPKNNNRCIAYPNTLVSDGFSMYYAGTDGIYMYNAYTPSPELFDSAFKSSNFIFDSGNRKIDTASCQSPVMEIWPDSSELYFSWPVVDASLVGGGDTCNLPPPIAASGLNLYSLVINLKYNTTDYRDFGMTAYCNFKSDPQLSGGDCNVVKYFFGVSGADYCMKQMGNGYAREFYNPATDTFSLAGYTPLFRGVFPFGDFALDKEMKSLSLGGAVDSNVGNFWVCRIGTSFEQMDPNNTLAGCAVIWHPMKPKPMQCQLTKSPEQYVAANIRPNIPMAQFNFLYRDRFLYYEISATDANGNTPTAGNFTVSRMDVMAMEV